jgi:hypothetical protein
MKVVKRKVTMMTMMNRCQKQLHFKLNINSVCTFSSNSKLEYFAGKLRALWELSGSSLGALWELVANAGILNKQELIIHNSVT